MTPAPPPPHSDADLAALDALLADQGDDRWNAFYGNRARPCPFFVTAPDESLAGWVDDQLVRPGKAIDLGCGAARNAIFLARRGFSVEAVDYSQIAIDWARERVDAAGADVVLRCQAVFDLDLTPGGYDLVYDSGCFHHIAPHRRQRYVELVATALKPEGWFGLTCFRPEGGSGYSDEQVYERRTLGGGLGYSEQRLRAIWSGHLQVRVVRQMNKPSAESGWFGEDFLSVLLAQKA